MTAGLKGQHNGNKEALLVVLTLQARPSFGVLDPWLHRLQAQTAHPGLRTLCPSGAKGWFMGFARFIIVKSI